MKPSIDLKNVSASLSRFFEKFHTIIFFVVIGIGLAISLLMLVGILNLSGKIDASQANQINQSFDEKTMTRLQNLNDDSTNNSIDLNSGRTNPFVD